MTAVFVVTGLYFILPLHSSDLAGVNGWWRLLVLLVGLGALTWLVAKQARRALRPEQALADRIAMLLTLVNMVVVAFATFYYLSADQFTGLQTRLDALYFSVVTLGTVGYGDVVPIGQAARAVVMVQILFDLVFVTSTVSIIVTAGRDASRH